MDMLDIMAAKQLAKTIQKGDKGDQGLKGDPGNGDLLAPDFSTSTAYKAGDYVIYDGKLYKFTAAHAAGAWDASQAEIATLAENLSEQSAEISALTLLEEIIPDTVQTIVFDSSGNVQQITHVRNSAAVRTDVFTFAASSITEVRTLATGESLTIVTNTDTLETTTTYADAA